MCKSITKQKAFGMLKEQVGSSISLQVHHDGLVFARSFGKLTDVTEMYDSTVVLEIDHTTVYVEADAYYIVHEDDSPRSFLQLANKVNRIACDVTPLQQILSEAINT